MALAQNPYRWLNLETLCQLLLPKNTIEQIKYFTALVSARPNDPDQPVRQQLYLPALRTLPKVSIHFGHFLTHEVTMALVVPPGQPTRYARVIKTEEKGSDVNLAIHLLHDAHMGRFDVAVVVSNDSDLLEPIKIVREQLRKPGLSHMRAGQWHMTEDEKRETIRMHLSLIMQHLLPSYAIALLGYGEGLDFHPCMGGSQTHKHLS
jgi:hypothetical protein